MRRKKMEGDGVGGHSFTKDDSIVIRVSTHTERQAHKLAGYLTLKAGENICMGRAIGVALEAALKKRGIK